MTIVRVRRSMVTSTTTLPRTRFGRPPHTMTAPVTRRRRRDLGWPTYSGSSVGVGSAPHGRTGIRASSHSVTRTIGAHGDAGRTTTLPTTSGIGPYRIGPTGTGTTTTGTAAYGYRPGVRRTAVAAVRRLRAPLYRNRSAGYVGVVGGFRPAGSRVAPTRSGALGLGAVRDPYSGVSGFERRTSRRDPQSRSTCARASRFQGCRVRARVLIRHAGIGHELAGLPRRRVCTAVVRWAVERRAAG